MATGTIGGGALSAMGVVGMAGLHAGGHVHFTTHLPPCRLCHQHGWRISSTCSASPSVATYIARGGTSAAWLRVLFSLDFLTMHAPSIFT